MNLEQVVCVQYVKKQQEDVKNSKSEKIQNYISGNILVHGLIKCQTCLGVWNRDVNGVTNIYRIAKNAINGLERPKYLVTV
jgi:transposase